MPNAIFGFCLMGVIVNVIRHHVITTLRNQDFHEAFFQRAYICSCDSEYCWLESTPWRICSSFDDFGPGFVRETKIVKDSNSMKF